MTQLVLREDNGAVCTLTLNRPEKRNAVNQDLFREFFKHVRDIETDGKHLGVIVLRGAGKAFCAGHDLSAPPSGDPFGWLRRENLTLDKLSTLPQSVIAAVHGQCMTGGLELALAADLIVCTETAEFADTHGKWGLVPGWGLSQRLPRRVGASKALEMMLTCRTYTGRQAEAMGLANFCASDTAFDAAVAALAQEVVANSWHSNAANKRLVYDTDGMRLREGVAHELFRSEGIAKDFQQRASAFGKRRTPE
jgi:enoyl-CoA hydratase